MVKIIISGANGKMGRVVNNCIDNRNDCKVVEGIDINTQCYSDFPIFESWNECNIKADVIIDFSNPSTLESLLEYAIKTKTAAVIATTGYSAEQVEKIKKAAEEIPIFFSFNMSLGVNLMVSLAKKAAAVLGDQFDIEIIEKHHNQKIDAPSGTALMIADAVNETLNSTKQYKYDRHSQRQKRDKNEIGIHAVRGGTIVGEHEIIFAGRDEVVTISHQAASKEIFAVGAVNAAVFLKDKPAGLYDMTKMLG